MASRNTEPVTAHASRREILKLGTAVAGVIRKLDAGGVNVLGEVLKGAQTQIAKSVFATFGGHAPAPASAEGVIFAKAEELRAIDPKLTKEQAVAKAATLVPAEVAAEAVFGSSFHPAQRA